MLKQIGVVGAALGWGQKLPGLEEAPRLLRMGGLLRAFENRGYPIADFGDIMECALTGINIAYSDTNHIATPPWLTHPEFGATYHRLAQMTQKISRQGRFCLTIGGDHSVALGSIAGLLKTYPDLRVLWVDAHGDVNTPESSISGQFHGMPVAGLLGQIKNWVGFDWLQNHLPPDRIAYVGVRDLDPAEEHLLADLHIQVYPMSMIRELGIQQVMSYALRALDKSGKAPLHLSFDIDAIDPQFAPLTGVPVHGGLTPFEVKTLAQMVAQTRRMVSMDLVEVNLLLSPDDNHARQTWSSVFNLCGNLFEPIEPNCILDRYESRRDRASDLSKFKAAVEVPRSSRC